MASPARALSTYDPDPPIQKFFGSGPVVDGLPVYREEWRIWTGRSWEPLPEHAFGIKPHPVIPAPPIPKRQRRLE